VQVDKEILSPVLQSFIPFWAQHIRTMNDMETLLLQELRDALLEPLMTGRIQFEDNQQAQASQPDTCEQPVDNQI
jgi:hypothetical protein